LFIWITFRLIIQKKSEFFPHSINMGQNGGARPGAGRKPKIQEIKIIEQMDAVSVPSEIWKALLYKVKEGDTQAIKLWLSYRFGMPKQQLDITTNGESIAPPISWITKEIEYKEAEVIDLQNIHGLDTHGLKSLAIHGLESPDAEDDMNQYESI